MLFHHPHGPRANMSSAGGRIASGSRSGWVLALSAEAFFPAAFLDDESHALVRGLVDSGVLEPAVQRRVLDAVDDLERMRRIRAAFPT